MSLAIDNLLESVKFTEFLFDNLPSAIFLVDKNIKVRKINNSYKALFSKEERDVINIFCGNSMGCSFAVEEDKPCGSTSECNICSIRNCVIKAFNKMENLQDTYIIKKFYISNNPIVKHFRIKAKQVNYKNEVMVIVAVDDITELEEQKQQIKDMANRDFLTNLYNRRYLYEISEHLYENAKRGNRKLSVGMIDIDHFKNINDGYGHKAGDFILTSLSEILMHNIRKADLVIRFGGEEFCLLMNVKKNIEAFNIIDKIRKIIEAKKFIFEDNIFSITISCGITNELENSFEDMIKRADIMLYKAKEYGRNQTVVFEN
jgi:diguanylate cyclase (GGDEF)-like protein